MAFGVKDAIQKRVETPIRTATVIACAALIVAVLALVVAAGGKK